MGRIALGSVALLLLTACQPSPRDRLVGVWQITELSLRTPDSSRTIANPQPGVLIVTERHYSFLHISGEEPRDTLSEYPSDAERLTALERLQMSTGTYEASDCLFRVTRMIAAYEQLMGQQHTSGYRIAGDTLWMNRELGDGHATFKFVRLE